MFKFFALLCLWWWCLFGWGQASVVRQGVLFQTQGDLAFSSTTHSLGLIFDVSNITRQLAFLSTFTEKLVQVANTNVTSLTSYFTAEIIQIATLINSTIKDINDFVTSFPAEEMGTKRFAGNVLGLATDNEIDDLVNQIKNLTGGHVVIDKVVSYLEVTDKQLDRLNQALYRVTIASTGFTHHIKKTDDVMAKVHTDTVMAQTINFLLFAAMDIQSEVAKLLTAIETQEQTRTPSTVFLPPDTFLSVLVTLQDHVNLLFPASYKFIPSFYDISNVITKRIGNKFIFFIRIPLKFSEEIFDLYYLTAMWHKQVGSDWARKLILEEPYLAVSRDMRLSMILPNLNTCVQSRTMTVCTPTMELDQDGGCVMDILRRKEPNNAICRFVYTSNYSPSFHKVGDGWVVTSPIELRVVQLCRNSPPKKSSIIPAGISKLPMKDMCRIVGASFSLPPFISNQHQNLEVEIDHSHAPFPSLPSPYQLKRTLKKLNLQHTDIFTHTQLVLLATPQESFSFREVLIIVCVVLGVITIDLLLRCWLKLRHHITCGCCCTEAQHTYEPTNKIETWVAGYNPPPKPTRKTPTPPILEPSAITLQRNSVDSDSEYVEMLGIVP